MVEQKHYDVVYNALKLACNTISETNMDITPKTMPILEYMAHGSLVGYYLMEAQRLIDEKNGV